MVHITVFQQLNSSLHFRHEIALKFLRTNLVFFCENYKNRCNNKRGQFDFYEYNVGVKIDFVQVKLFYLDKKVLCFEQFTSILYPIGSRKSKSRDTDQCNECRVRACSVMRCSLEQRFSPHFVVAPAIVKRIILMVILIV